MSGTAKLRSRAQTAAKTTIWRGSHNLGPAERQKFVARRAGLTLIVALSSNAVRATAYRITTWPQNPRLRQQQVKLESMWPIANLSDRRNVNATIVFAKRWAETQADKLRDARGAE